jgi:hypothetical protein
MTVMSRTRRFAPVPLLLLVAALAATACSTAAATERGSLGGGSSSSAGGTEPGTVEPGGAGGGGALDPDAPVTGSPIVDDPAPDGDGALHVTPQKGIINPVPHTFDRVTVSADGRTLTVYYWGGVDACYGLASAEAIRNADGTYTILVLEGTRDTAAEFACIDIALLKAVDITLDEPIFHPGAVGVTE